MPEPTEIAAAQGTLNLKAAELSVISALNPDWIEVVKLQLERQEDQRRFERRVEVLGQVSGLIVALAFLASATTLTLMGHEVAGVILGTVDVVALVTVFVLGRRTHVAAPGGGRS